jgi:ABC-2 type transport system permease protein
VNGRLSTWAAAFVVARRDFTAILWSRSFIFFLLGPLFPVIVGGFAGGIGQRVQEAAVTPALGIAMPAPDAEAMQAAHRALAPRIGAGLPDLVVIARPAPGETFDARAALEAKTANVAAIVTGRVADPMLTGTEERVREWAGPVSLLSAQALGRAPQAYPQVRLDALPTTTASQRQGQVLTAQAGQLLLFLLTMLLAGMVLSNLVEEKGNKIIEVLAAAIPMDAFAMLAVSFVGIAVWGGAGGLVVALGGDALPSLPEPAVGWPMFIAFGVIYFAMAYLLIGALFLTIGSMATTVREVQTLSMPVTFLQLLFFFVASFAVAAPGTAWEWIAIVVPFSSPYAMLARAAQDAALWPHAVVLLGQALCVGLLIRIGARLFRKLVMKSGPAGGGGAGRKRGLFARLRPLQS